MIYKEPIQIFTADMNTGKVAERGTSIDSWDTFQESLMFSRWNLIDFVKMMQRGLSFQNFLDFSVIR